MSDWRSVEGSTASETSRAKQGGYCAALSLVIYKTDELRNKQEGRFKMYVSFKNLTITEIEEKHGEHIKGKWREFKKPKQVAKVVFQDEYCNLMDLAVEVKHAAERTPHNKIIVNFEVDGEY